MDEKLSLTDLSRKESEMLRGIAILLVLLGHTEYIRWGGAGGVGIFLLLSGYGLNESVKRGGLKGYWYKRFRTVYLPYLFIAVYGLFVFGFETPEQVLVTLLGLDFKLNIDSTMWYITYILFWYIIFYVTELLCRALRLRGAAEGIVKIFLLLAATSLVRLLAKETLIFHLKSDAVTYRLMFPIGVAFSLLSGIRVKKTGVDLFVDGGHVPWPHVLFQNLYVLLLGSLCPCHDADERGLCEDRPSGRRSGKGIAVVREIRLPHLSF